ncbi:hypothetical protein KC878_01310 [Candidatus Saccharibacteria bacterium]|nr:hypothetical protein [Candidatus Saccharibacteria bacterium]MCB9821123.1 hypothetical protein [Candidatus Nomurabacteria bacterium]
MALQESLPTRIADGLDEAHRTYMAEPATEFINNSFAPEQQRKIRRVARVVGAVATAGLVSFVAWRGGMNVKEAWDTAWDSSLAVADRPLEVAKDLLPSWGEAFAGLGIAAAAASSKAIGTERHSGDPVWSERDGVTQRAIAAKRRGVKWVARKKQNVGIKLGSRVAGKQAKQRTKFGSRSTASDTHFSNARRGFGVPGRGSYRRVNRSIERGEGAGRRAARSAGRAAKANYNMSRRTRIDDANQARVDRLPD